MGEKEKAEAKAEAKAKEKGIGLRVKGEGAELVVKLFTNHEPRITNHDFFLQHFSNSCFYYLVTN